MSTVRASDEYERLINDLLKWESDFTWSYSTPADKMWPEAKLEALYAEAERESARAWDALYKYVADLEIKAALWEQLGAPKP